MKARRCKLTQTESCGDLQSKSNDSKFFKHKNLGRIIFPLPPHTSRLLAGEDKNQGVTFHFFDGRIAPNYMNKTVKILLILVIVLMIVPTVAGILIPFLSKLTHH